MPEPIEAEQPKQEEKAPVVDPARPLGQQVDKLLEAVPEKKDENKADDDKKSDESDKDNKPADDSKEDSGDSEGKSDDKPEPEPDDDEDEPEPEQKLEDLPPLAKYVFERLPDIQAYGHVGEGKPDKIIKVKRLQDLPDDFEFATRKAEREALIAHNANEINARELASKYEHEQQQRQYQALKDQENKDIASDLKALQKEGLLPKFKYSETDSRFNDDPAVKEANEIYDLMQKTNNSFINRKVNYRISYRDAADKYYAQQARKDKTSPKKSAEDEERERTAHKVTARTTSDDTPKRLPPGTTTRDIMRLFDAGRI